MGYYVILQGFLPGQIVMKQQERGEDTKEDSIANTQDSRLCRRSKLN